MLSVRVLHAQAPMKMFEEIMAITTRVAPSFIRIGHVDLHSRRCQPTTAAARVYPGTPAEAKAALRQLVCPSVTHLNMSLEVGKYHDCFRPQVELTIAREFPEIHAKVGRASCTPPPT